MAVGVGVCVSATALVLLIQRVGWAPPPSPKQKQAGGREESGLEATTSCLLLCSLRSILKRKRGPRLALTTSLAVTEKQWDSLP